MTTGKSLRVGEAVLGGVVLAVGLFVVVETSQLQVAQSHAAIGPTLFPYLIATGLVVVGGLLFYQAFFGHIAHERGFELDWRAVALVSGGLILQMFLIESLGWIIATTLLFIATTIAFGSRRLLTDAAIGVVLSGLAFVVFNYGLGLDLPTGTAFEQLFSSDEEAP